MLVGPDNGLLAPAVAMAGGADRAVALTNADYQLPAPGPTFAGRDVFAPAAAHLCNGVDLAELGDVDRSGDAAARASCRCTRRRRRGSSARCCGSTASATPAQHRPRRDRRAAATGCGRVAATVRVASPRRGATRRCGTGELGLVVDSYGLLSICLDRGSAADELRVCGGRPR